MTITGTNFAAGAMVTFGGAAATNVAVMNSTTITATTPGGSAGAVTVTVTVSGQSGNLTSGFTYVVVPTVSSVSPNSGSTAGGTAVTITGTNFAAGATVTFGSAAATGVTVVNGTTITATTPAHAAGAVTVVVTVNGQSGSLATGFTYNGTVAIGFAQVAAAVPQSPTGDSKRDLSGSADGGGPEHRGSRVERHHGDGAVGKGQCGEQLPCGDWADERDGAAAIDLLCGEHRGRVQYGDGDVQPIGGVSGCADSGVPGSDDAGCDGGGEREWNGCE